MSFVPPSNVPRFTDPQRRFEDNRWESSGMVGNARYGHGGRSTTGSGRGIAGFGSFLDKNELPMYKDKPYGYATSTRLHHWWRRKRVVVTGVIALVGLLYWLGVQARSWDAQANGEGRLQGAGSSGGFGWLRRGSGSTTDWDERRERVKKAFVSSWDAYDRHAWGYDEFHPIAKSGRQMSPKGLGWIIVDSLDTLILMNLTSRLSHAREWLSTSLDYEQDRQVNTFETTIRMLGGLLSAHYLSTTYPDLAPLSDDNVGAPGEDLYLEKATDLAYRLLGAFSSNSGIPYANVNLKTQKGDPSDLDGGASSTAEAGSLQLEMKYIAHLTGERNYWDKAEKAIQVIDDNGAQDGLVPIFIYATTGGFRGDNIRLGSRGDSYYEYLIKQYLQTSQQEPIYLEMWKDALRGMRKHLLTYSKAANLTVLAELPDGIGRALSPKMDHLVCFLPGTIALGATGGLTVAGAKAAAGGKWSAEQEADMQLARELTQTCWGMYRATATGLAGEITHFQLHDPPLRPSDDVRKPATTGDIFRQDSSGNSNSHSDSSSSGGSGWSSDFIVKPLDAHNLQRPETVESLFYMWRITRDERYRHWGWEMFESFERHTSVGPDGGFTSINDVNAVPTSPRDNMESFWLAETLKYFYLLFSPPDLLPLDQIVINTEAHVFPRFALGKLFSTGWRRKLRDKNGSLAPSSPTAAGAGSGVGGGVAQPAAAAPAVAPTVVRTVVVAPPPPPPVPVSVPVPTLGS
ncbi:MAG: mannosyl-oligosaccharide alpha-1,2-mannosidase [Phylliscum demangeonii]|nr:MAG: mannosyl-oligosaccharide alpha-1,2-mannosidase [Phylliscum demangeonii]